MKKLHKRIALILVLATLLCSLFGCMDQTDDPTTTEDPTITTDPPVTTGTPTGGEPTMDIWWDTDPEFKPLTNDIELDTKGNTLNGSWFESYEYVKRLQWEANDSTEFSYQNGTMVFTSPTRTEALLKRNVITAENFELEFRAKVEHFGEWNGIYVSFGGVRASLYLHETKLRVNNQESSTEGTAKAGVAYADVGFGWHTYRLCVKDRMVALYMDGVFMTSANAEATGVTPGQIGLFAKPNNTFNPTTMIIDYISYKVLDNQKIQITSPQRGAVCGTGITTVNVSCSIDATLASAGSPVQYYLNGVYAGERSAASPGITLADLAPGMYAIYAVCGEERSGERVFAVGEANTEVLEAACYSNAEQLQSSYILRWQMNGDGAVSAGDGFFPLSLTFGGGKMQYESLDGKERISGVGDSGSYLAVVDGGIADIYRNGRLLVSYRMPYAVCGSTPSATGSVSGLAVEAHNPTYFVKDMSNGAPLDTTPGSITYNYAVELEYTTGKSAQLILSDGAYSMNLTFAADGKLCGVIAPLMTAYEDVLCTLPEGTHFYRITVCGGIAQIFADNLWLASFRMPATVAKRALWVKGEGMGTLQLRGTADRYYFGGRTTDADWGAYFDNRADYTSDQTRLLKVYSKNTTVSATLQVGSSTTGSFYLLARYFPSSGLYGVYAGYDFDANCYRIGRSLNNLESFPAARPQGEVKLEARVIGGKTELLCNGQVVATQTEAATHMNGWGNAGYLNRMHNGSMQGFDYAGDGNPLRDSSTTLIEVDHTVGIFEMGDTVYATGDLGTYISKDDGKTFDKAPYDFANRGYNMIVLQSGKLLSLVRHGNGSGYQYHAYISETRGNTFSGPYPVNDGYNSYRFTMNGKVMQASSGRVFFVSGETENENSGQLWIYYSDDEGKTWKKSTTEFNQKTTGMNLQEGCVVELGGGVIRMYARNDCGFLVYADSRDGGKIWDTDMKISNFASVVSAFNVTKDSQTGAIYLAWEYTNKNDNAAVQYPRTRVGLAVSYDNAATWYYVGDADDSNWVSVDTWKHMNIGVWATKNAVFVTVARMIVGGTNAFRNYTVRIGKESICPLARFTSLRGPLRDPLYTAESRQLQANSGLLVISESTGRVYASGDCYSLDRVDGKHTALTVEMIASFLNGKLTKNGKTATVRVGNAEYVFTAGALQAQIAGKTVTLSAPVTEENGSICVNIMALHDAMGLTVRRADCGAILLSVDDTPICTEQVLSLTAVW